MDVNVFSLIVRPAGAIILTLPDLREIPVKRSNIAYSSDFFSN
jgi:hypothetical protein